MASEQEQEPSSADTSQMNYGHFAALPSSSSSPNETTESALWNEDDDVALAIALQESEASSDFTLPLSKPNKDKKKKKKSKKNPESGTQEEQQELLSSEPGEDEEGEED